jgi:hypothetical protein
MSGAAAAWTSGRSASHRYARGRVLGSRLVLFANPALDGQGGEDFPLLLGVLVLADELVRGELELHLVRGVQRPWILAASSLASHGSRHMRIHVSFGWVEQKNRRRTPPSARMRGWGLLGALAISTISRPMAWSFILQRMVVCFFWTYVVASGTDGLLRKRRRRGQWTR